VRYTTNLAPAPAEDEKTDTNGDDCRKDCESGSTKRANRGRDESLSSSRRHTMRETTNLVKAERG